MSRFRRGSRTTADELLSMRLLLDENLPRSAVPAITHMFVGSSHVADCDLTKSDDSEVWRYALEHGYAVVSKDRDFADRAIVHGPEPKVIWLRLGNCAARAVSDLILSYSDVILDFQRSRDAGLLVLPPGLLS